MKTAVAATLKIIVVLSLLFLPYAKPAAASAPTFSCGDVTEIPQTECNALVALYSSTNGDSWTNKTNWLTNTPSNWFGVTVNSGHVTGINLQLNQLSGPLPSELGDLPALQTLYLYSNQLTGPIPPALGNLSSLIWLNLSSNQLTGSIPPQLGNLPTLASLELANNGLSGSIPTQLGNLTTLIQLNLHVNVLTGEIPFEIGYLTALQTLSLFNNELTGGIPSEIGSLTALTTLMIYNNPLSGSVPLSITNLSQLDRFEFQDTSLCEPATFSYLAWKNSVEAYTGTGVSCGSGSPFLALPLVMVNAN